MEFALTEDQSRFRSDVYAYLKRNVPAGLEPELETRIEGDGPVARAFVRKLGRDGWMGIGWPREYGGHGRSAIEQYIFFDLTMGYFAVPIQMLSLMTVGPTLMRVGTEEQKRTFLPPILTGDLVFAIGYTEPEAGTDLLSLRTTATRDGDDYVINGEKVFTSMGHFCDYFWLAARTDPNAAKKHKGISIFLVDARSPGITVEPMDLLGSFRTSHEHFDNVRVPKECLVGEENKGWEYMMTQLVHERIGLVPHSAPVHFIEDTCRWAREHRMNGRPVVEQSWVSNKLADMVVETELVKLLNYRVAWMLAQGSIPHLESSMIKAYGSEQIQRVLGGCLQIMGLFGQLEPGSPRAPVQGRVERLCRMELLLTFGGGTNEVMKDLIAMLGLGMLKTR